jgi:CBS domain containing-hemolysin-like protein
MSVWNNILALIGLILVDLLVTTTRASLLNARWPYLYSLREKHLHEAERTIDLLQRPNLTVALRLAGSAIHFLVITAGVLLVMHVYPIFPRPVVLGGCLLLGVMLFWMLEYALEGLALREVELSAVRLTPAARIIEWVFRPLSALMIGLRGGVPVVSQRTPGSVTDDELKNWVEESQPSGGLEEGERKMIASIFQFGDTLCREIMVPRTDVLALEASTSLPDAIHAVLHSGHSRFPVYDDDTDNIVGLLYAKDLLQLQAQQEQSIRGLLREAYFVPDAKKVDELLREMQERGFHLAVVIDEYGGMAGIVTMEDIVEEIVGEIRDEYDEKEELPFLEISPDEFIFQGKINLDDVNELLDTDLESDAADSLGGFIYDQIGRVPTGGEMVEVDGWVLMVEQVSRRRIRKVRAQRRAEPAPPQPEEIEDGTNP